MARFVRDDVLRVLCDSTRSTVVSAGIEYPCWRLATRNWTAVLVNQWDIARSQGREFGIDRDQLLTRDILHLNVHADHDPVVVFDYGDDPSEDRLVTYRHGDWERIFEGKRRSLEAFNAAPISRRSRDIRTRPIVEIDWAVPRSAGSRRRAPLA